ncbi:MAG: TolC family protein [Phycisphaeraceae bacterium]|nr:MAG: TolC family protein [Phycisphaeraceae bacterium]
MLGAAAVLLVAGCQSYHPVPLTRDAVDAALETPELSELNKTYRPEEHPGLPPITIDPADGIEPTEAACIAAILNPSLRSARSRRGIAAAQLIQAGLLPNPQLSASLDIPSGGATDGTVNAYGLGVSWDITALIQQQANINAARASDTAAILDLMWQEWQVANAARLAATQAAWRNTACLALEQAVDEAAASADTIFQARDAGEATGIDAAAANATLQAYTSRLRTAERDRDLAALQAKRAMGLPPDAELAFTAPGNVDAPAPSDLATIFAIARDRRVDLAALRYGYESKEENVRAAILSQFPRISFGVNAARDTGDVQTIGVGISIDLPIFDRSQGRIANERATREVLYNEYIEREFAL